MFLFHWYLGIWVGKLCPRVGILFRFFRPWGRSFALKSCPPGAGILMEKISGPGVSPGGMVTGQIDTYINSLRKTAGRVSPILVTLTSRSDSNFERSNISLKENRWDGVDSNSNGFDHCVRKKEGKIPWFSAYCKVASIIQVIIHTHFNMSMRSKSSW